MLEMIENISAREYVNEILLHNCSCVITNNFNKSSISMYCKGKYEIKVHM